MRIICKTLFDITQTNVNTRRTTPTGNINHERQRGQQSNFETLLQIISMRAQPENIQPPEKTMESLDGKWGNKYTNETKVPVWTFSFDVVFGGVFDDGVSKLGYLYADCSNVPMIANLEEWAAAGSSLNSSAELRNVYFEVSHG